MVAKQLSIEDWHSRFQNQSAWTESLREYLLKNNMPPQASRVLEIGSGTGVITQWLGTRTSAKVYGIDLDYSRVQYARQYDTKTKFITANTFALPFTSNSFDFICTHYLFLWLDHPLKALSEILRVLKPGGVFVSLAEPDYTARIDSPATLIRLGQLQSLSLESQGVNLSAGREIGALAVRAGYKSVRVGVSGFEQSLQKLPGWWHSEWAILENDLYGMVPKTELFVLKDQDLKAWNSGERVLWVPTFYAIGKKPVT